jgi:hypothetical protein
MDVFEHLIILMIIRREIINFGIKTNHIEFWSDLNAIRKKYYRYGSLESEYAQLTKNTGNNGEFISLVD